MAGRRPARPGRRWPAIHRRPSMRVFRFRNTGRPSGLRVAGCRGRPTAASISIPKYSFTPLRGGWHTPPRGGDAKCYTPHGRGGPSASSAALPPAAKSTLASSPCAPCQILRLLDRKTFHA
jgi:hypothetical protein